jgi:hypothetical protein
MKFMRRTIGYTLLYYKNSINKMEELDTQPVVVFTQKYMFFKCPIQESLSKFSITNKKR